MLPPNVTSATTVDRESLVLGKLKTSLHSLTGIPQESLDEHATFLELGLDSLFLTRANAAFTNEFGVKITFRQLFEEAPTLQALAEYIDQRLPDEAFADELAPPSAEPTAEQSSAPPMAPAEGQGIEGLLTLVQQQLQITARQLELMQQMTPGAASSPVVPTVPVQTTTTASPPSDKAQGVAGPWKPIAKGTGTGLTATQADHLQALTERLTSRLQESKRLTAEHRPHFADARTVAGFRRAWKELVFPVVVNRSSGSRVWDVDGNEFVDIAMGFGVSLFGHSPPFILDAVRRQLDQGMEIGPQSPRAGAVARRICEFTGMDRAAFCNTGSEAVLAALRMARTVTGRDRIATFAGDYHGLFDEVLGTSVVTAGQRRTVPVAPGIPPWMVEGVAVLEYGNPDSLEVIREQARELAAVIVEPVQSRHPDLQPREFLHALRELTEQLRIPLIFDEMITGFRFHPGGAQAWFGVEADIATYGKVIGGGFPTGIVAGKRLYMDALDGGEWRYGDDSFPEAGVTWFAGTFVRHPVALAAIEATLDRLEEEGPDLQRALNANTKSMVDELNQHFDATGVPIWIESFSSVFLVTFKSDQEFASLFYLHLRDQGIHVTEGRAAFLSTAHSEADIAFIVRAFKQSAKAMQEGGFFPGQPATAEVAVKAPALEEGEILVPLTTGQLEIWLGACMGDDANCAFNLSNSIYLEGKLDHDALDIAIRQLVQRCDALRATITEDGTDMRIAPNVAIDVPRIDLSADEPAAAERRIAELQQEEVETPFDLVQGPLFRSKVVKVTPERHVVLLTAHHIVCDGWSTGVIMRELGAAYTAAIRGEVRELDEPLSFQDFADRQRDIKRSTEFEKAQAYWLDRLSPPLPVLDLPSDRPRLPHRTYEAFREELDFAPETVNELKRIGAKQGCTLSTTLLAAYETFLFRLTGQSDVVVGLIAAGQPVAGEANLVGHCVNLLPIRCQFDGKRSFNEVLTSIRGPVLDAFEHQCCNFGSLLGKLVLPRDSSRVPLVSTIFNVDPTMQGVSFHGLNVSVRSNPRSFETFDQFFNIVDRQTNLTIECTFNRNLFDRATMRRRLDEFQTLLAGIVANPEQPLASLPLLPAEEQRLLSQWNETTEAFREDLCVHELFQKQADRVPDAVAAIFPADESSLTYGELDRRSNQLARYLATQGVRSGDHVALCVERSPDMLVGLLAVMKAGAAYVPLDPTSPLKRLETMLEDSGATILLTQETLLDSLPSAGTPVVCVDRDAAKIAAESPSRPDWSVDPDAVVYTIYTSGSTGKPKGVQVRHRSVVNLLTAVARRPGFSAEDVLLAVATISFDIAAIDMFLPLSCGGRMLVASSEEAQDGALLMGLLARHRVSFMQATPTTWRLMISAGWQGSPDLLAISTGEALPRELATELLERSQELWNMYGPTETTVWSLGKQIDSPEGPILVGRPIGNTQIYLLDDNQQPVPVGASGELYIGGAGVAKGYWGRPDLTNEKFVLNPLSGGRPSPLYRTGDLARYRADGNVEFLGRIDNQVKLRGFRIELGEIETVLESHDRIDQATLSLCDRGSPEARLVAYYMSKNGELPRTELRDDLRQYLPEFMVPSAFVQLEEFPLTTSGKVDRGQLLAPDVVRMVDDAFVAPRSATEQSLAAIWVELLRIDRVGVHDNFFDLGGHSLMASQMTLKVRAAFDVELPLREVFESPTVEKLSEYIDTVLWARESTVDAASELAKPDTEIVDI